MIYCNGDSFVAGVELADHILPEYPGLTDWVETTNKDVKHNQRNVDWITKTYDDNHPLSSIRKERSKDLIRIEYERAFPNKLQEILNIPVINRALGGASMDRIVRTTISDLIELKKTHDSIIAVIGTTYIGRSEIATFNEEHDLFGDICPWICITTNYKMHYKNRDLDCLLKYKTLHDSDYHHFVNFFKNIILLQDFCKSNNIKLHWISTYNNMVDYNKPIDSKYHFIKDLINLSEYANLKYTIDMRQIACNIKKEVLCPSGHYAEIVHEKTAELLIPILRGELNV